MGIENSIDLTTEQRKLVITLLSQYLPKTTVWAYGSRVAWTSCPDSDLDLVVFSTPEQKKQISLIKDAFEECNLPFKVDLFTWDEVPAEFKNNILKQYIVIIDTKTDKTKANWPLVTIDSIKADEKGAIAIGTFGSRMKSDCYVQEGIPVIRGTNITGGPAFEGNFVYISEEKADTLCSSNVYQYDLVFPHRGAIGEVGIILDDKRYVISSSLMKLTCDRKKVNSKFLYYFFKSYLGKHELFKNASQVGTPGIGQLLTLLKSVELHLPPLPVQDQIEEILTSLDDKIELNKQMNHTMEQSAQAIFKSWFVDFDPVIDNAQTTGNAIPEAFKQRAEKRKQIAKSHIPLQQSKDKSEQQPLPAKLPERILKLFPDKFELNEELGWIPENWNLSNIGNEFKVTMGRSPPGSTYNESKNGIAFFQGRADFGFRYPSNRVYCTAPKRMASKDDTLVSVRAPVGDVNMAFVDSCIGRGVSAVKHKSDSRSYTYYSMLQLREQFKVFEAEGTVFGSINQKDFNGLKWLEHDLELIKEYESVICRLDDRIENCSSNTMELTELRNALISKLISGEFEIPSTNDT